MKIIADLHTHSMVSQHAYSTIDEITRAAQDKGFCAVATTDHGPQMPDGAIAHHFYCLGGLPESVNGLTLYKGAEANILDFDGNLDMESSLLKRLDFVIASYHIECIQPVNLKAHTQGLIRAIENPLVDCLGHCGNPVFPIDIPAVVGACATQHKLIEINSASFLVRPGSDTVCEQVARLCAQRGVQIVVNSDAHSRWQVGEHTAALAMLDKISFPEELVINSSPERLSYYFEHRRTARQTQ